MELYAVEDMERSIYTFAFCYCVFDRLKKYAEYGLGVSRTDHTWNHPDASYQTLQKIQKTILITMKTRFSILILLALPLLFTQCNPSGGKQEGTLPILGNKHVEEVTKNGETVQDTVYHKIADFSFTNQEGKTISNEYVDGKVYIADFFFTTCPTICPIMKKEMLRVYEKYKDNPDFKILSHSIDPSYDTQEVLHDYAEKLGIEDDNTWNFLTGDPQKIYEIGQTSYLTTAMEDQDEPGGFLHSGAFVLVDQNGHIRGVYDGTKTDQVDRLINDIPRILEK